MSIDPDVLARLEALTLETSAPLLVVDVDEVLVGLAAHLTEFAEAHGFSLRLTSYKLDGALKRADGTEASEEEFKELFKAFFQQETRHQRVYPGAAETLHAVSVRARIVILTNVPPYAEAARIQNLRQHGINYPLIVNQGGKGKALAWLSERTSGPVVFIDDSPAQITSAARNAPSVVRLHYVGDDMLRGFLDTLPDADYSPESWNEIGTILNAIFDHTCS